MHTADSAGSGPIIHHQHLLDQCPSALSAPLQHPAPTHRSQHHPLGRYSCQAAHTQPGRSVSDGLTQLPRLPVCRMEAAQAGQAAGCPLCWLPRRLVYVRHVRTLDSKNNRLPDGTSHTSAYPRPRCNPHTVAVIPKCTSLPAALMACWMHHACMCTRCDSPGMPHVSEH